MSQGSRFSQIYLKPKSPRKDSERFRRRLSAFYDEELADTYYYSSIKRALEVEGGMVLPGSYYGSAIGEFLRESDLRDLLDCITLIYGAIGAHEQTRISASWKLFVERCFREESMGYRLDEACIVHFHVDEEFEKGRASTIQLLDDEELNSVKAAYDDVFRHLDSQPMDTKAAVRSMFEALEIRAKQLVETKNLNRFVAEKSIKELAIAQLGHDKTQKAAMEYMLKGFGDWVDALHLYRHGQKDDEPVAPSEDFTVYVVSSGSAYLRILAKIQKA